MTTVGSNSGIYFHTEYQEGGWPSKGYEVQVNNSHTTESEGVQRPPDMAKRLLSSGTFALQGHDPKSKVLYKNIMVKVLP